MQIDWLIMAAGASRRMRTPKQLLPIGQETLLGRAIRQARTVSSGVWVVTADHTQAHIHHIQAIIHQTGCPIIQNPHWAEGLGNSIACGVKKLCEQTSPDGIGILLADQPLVSSELISRLETTFRSQSCALVATQYFDSQGVPAIFSPVFYSALSELKGDQGAKKIIMQSQSKILLPLPEAHCDLDTPEDYRTFLGKEQK